MTPGHLFRTLFTALLVSAAPAAVLAAPSPNDYCYGCHKSDVHPDKFKASVHGESKIKCIECHEDAPLDRDHPEKLKPVNCANCHEDAVKEFDGSAHGKAIAAGNTASATCKSCHGSAHEILASADEKSPTNVANVEATCGSCHGNDKVVKEASLPGGNVQALYHDSIHGRLLREKTSAKAPSCTSCHGAHGIVSHKDKDSKVSHANIPQTCGSCHQRALTQFHKGKHGQLQQAGSKEAPVCSDCHTAHSISRASMADWQIAAIGQCGNCHDEYVSSYRLTYHGKVTNLGYSNIATCASCHGGHEILPASDPASPISPQNRLETCRQCHKDASAQFASWDPHPRPASIERDPLLYFANIAMNWLLIGVFGFFGLHTVLWAYRGFADALKRRRSGDKNR